MHRTFSLSPTHFAAGWAVPTEEEFNNREEVNALAIQYAISQDGPDREALFLRLVECFHGYLIKYMNMVTRGQLPSQHSRAGKDAARFLKSFIKKDMPADQKTLLAKCRTLHLAFKQETTDGVYDVLVLCFLRACHRYDPNYHQKVRQVCEVLDARFASQLQFTVADVSAAVGFDAVGHLRLLARKCFLAAVRGPKKKVLGYKRSASWPPPAKFFESGPVGFTYFVQRWFQFYLSDYIEKTMDELETQENVLQLDHRPGSALNPSIGKSFQDIGVPSAVGAFTDAKGSSWAADTSLMEGQFDVSQMNDEWVRGTHDRLFRNMTRQERKILQLVYVNEFSWQTIADTLGLDVNTVRRQYDQIMAYLRGHVTAKARN